MVVPLYRHDQLPAEIGENCAGGPPLKLRVQASAGSPVKAAA